MAQSAAQTKATTQYIKRHLKTYVMRCHKENDADIIDYLESCGNVAGTLKRLVREEIARNAK